jgi:hypothetical protein
MFVRRLGAREDALDHADITGCLQDAINIRPTGQTVTMIGSAAGSPENQQGHAENTITCVGTTDKESAGAWIVRILPGAL